MLANAGADGRALAGTPAAPLWENRGVDFRGEIDEVGAFLAGRGAPYAVVGGVALAGYGHPRMTLDLDLVTDIEAQDALVAFMEGRGFDTLHRSSGYSNHLHQDRRHGRVDVVYVRGETARRLFGALRSVPGPGGSTIPVPKPEHLIAMKVQAMRDAPERTWQELVDIGHLVRLDGVDRNEVRGYFEKSGLLERWHELERAL
jgi:Nucleotidyl transferase AbiEii toxin, Type IV TA system